MRGTLPRDPEGARQALACDPEGIDVRLLRVQNTLALAISALERCGVDVALEAAGALRLAEETLGETRDDVREALEVRS